MSAPPVVVLLSIGRSPVSGRPRPAERDARAVAVALASGRGVIGVHAGLPDDVLRSYAGMGLSRVVAVAPGPGDDPIPALSAFLAGMMAEAGAVAAILAGCRSEAGEGSGLVPYAVAAALGIPVLPAVTALQIGNGSTRATQALPGGRRRPLDADGPVLGTVDAQGPPIRQVARGSAARATIEIVASVPGTAPPSLSPAIVADRPARLRPKRIGPEEAGGARMQSLLVAPAPREAALEILRFLEGERVIASRPAEHTSFPKGPP